MSDARKIRREESERHGGFKKVLMRENGCTTRSAQIMHEREQAKEPGIKGDLLMIKIMSKLILPTHYTL